MITMKYNYKTHGTCSQYITFDLENGIVHDVSFMGGCHGNLQAIGKLVDGMRAEDIIGKIKGVDCGGRGTSCGDQLAIALKAAMDAQSNQ